MEKFLDTYSEDSQFKLGILQAPESAFAILNNWENMMDIFVSPSPDQPARNKAIAGRKLSQAIGIRTSLLHRYSWLEEKAHLNDLTTLSYCHELVQHRLRVDQHRYNSEANMQRVVEGMREREANGGPLFGTMNRGVNGEKPVLAPIKIDDETEKELRRKAMLAQLSPLEVLKILDESVESLVQGVLSLDYFDLFDQSVQLLDAVTEAYGAEFKATIDEHGARPDCLATVPLFISVDLMKGAKEDPAGKKTLGTLVESVKLFLERNLLWRG